MLEGVDKDAIISIREKVPILPVKGNNIHAPVGLA
jgi:hypothetical protein